MSQIEIDYTPLMRANSRVVERWRKHAPHDSIQFTSTVFAVDFMQAASRSLDECPEEMYEYLAIAYQSELDLVCEMDRLSPYLEARVRKIDGRPWTTYQHARTVARACNLALNGMQDRRRQVLAVIMSHELMLEYRK